MSLRRFSHIGRWVVLGWLVGLIAIAAQGSALTTPALDKGGMCGAEYSLVVPNADHADDEWGGVGDPCDLELFEAADHGILAFTATALDHERRNRVVTAWPKLSLGGDAADVEDSRLRLEGMRTIVIPPTPKLGDRDEDGIPDLMVMFRRPGPMHLLCDPGRETGIVEIRLTEDFWGKP